MLFDLDGTLIDSVRLILDSYHHTLEVHGIPARSDAHWLAGLTPSPFVEIGTDLAGREGIETGDRVIVESARGSVEVYALVTERFQPFFVDGRLVDEVGLPWHWGYAGLVTGDIANDLTASVGDPNTFIPETKVFLCRIRRKA